jgi:hypothetical protein
LLAEVVRRLVAGRPFQKVDRPERDREGSIGRLSVRVKAKIVDTFGEAEED